MACGRAIGTIGSLQPPAGVALAVAMLVFVVISLILTPAGVFFSTDGGSKYILTRAFCERAASWPALPYPGRVWDPEGDFFPIQEAFAVRQAEYYISAFPVYFPMLSSFGLRACGFRGLYIIPLVSALVCLWLAARLGRRLGWSRRMVFWGILLLAFATPFGFYASTFWEHVPALTLLFAGLVVLLGRAGAGRGFAAGLLMGLSMVLRPECIWTCAALVLGAASVKSMRERLRWRGILALAGGIATGGALLVAANQILYGVPQGPQLIANLGYPARPRLLLMSRMLAGRDAGLRWLIPALAALLLGMVPGKLARNLRLIAFAALFMRMAHTLALERHSYAAYRSLIGALETSPFLFLVPMLEVVPPPGDRALSSGGIIPPVPAMESGPGSAALLFGRASAWSALAVVLTSPVDGGLQGGNRLLLPSIALGLISVLTWLSCGEPTDPRPERTGLKSTERRPLRLLPWRRIALVTGLVLSLPLCLRAFPYFLYRARQVDHPALVRIRQLPGDALVYTNSAFPQGLAAAYWDRPSFYVTDSPSLARLLDQVGRFGARRIWLLSWPRTQTPARVPAAGGTDGPPGWTRAQSLLITSYQCDLYTRTVSDSLR